MSVQALQRACREGAVRAVRNLGMNWISCDARGRWRGWAPVSRAFRRSGVATPALQADQLHEGAKRLFILVEGFNHGPTGGPDPTPVPDDRSAAEERRLYAGRIEPAHVVRGVYALEMNWTVIDALHAENRA